MDLVKLFNTQYDRTTLIRALDEKLSFESHHAVFPTVPEEQYTIQKELRPVFGKEGINRTAIGTHPDFYDLEQRPDEIRYQYVCTLFVDIVGSTRLNLLYTPEEVLHLKNAVIQTCIEVIRSFDGYIHRIMGDAVMAFFGSQSMPKKEDAIADAINAAACLRVFLENGIKPWMESKNYDPSDFGFRVGVDFGDDDKVCWGHFGYQGTGEVSAVGLNVDMASKLQNKAPRNETMMGESLLELSHWPNAYSKVKTSIKDGETVHKPIVTPNITNLEGNPLNYRMKMLDFKKYLRTCALPLSLRSRFMPGQLTASDVITYECYVKEKSEGEFQQYHSASRYLDANLSLEFRVGVVTRSSLKFPLTVTFTKTNHGKDVPEEEQNNPDKPRTKIIYKPQASRTKQMPHMVYVNIDEHTRYRGLHTMQCVVKDSGDRIVFRDWIGVLIRNTEKDLEEAARTDRALIHESKLLN